MIELIADILVLGILAALFFLLVGFIYCLYGYLYYEYKLAKEQSTFSEVLWELDERTDHLKTKITAQTLNENSKKFERTNPNVP